MAQTPILAIPQIAEGQSSAYLVANAGITALEEAENRQLAVDMSGGDVTLTEAQFLRNVLFRCSGQVADDDLIIPDEITVDGSPVTPQRKFLVRNDSDTYSVTVTDGTLTFEIPTESTALLIYDGYARQLHRIRWFLYSRKGRRIRRRVRYNQGSGAGRGCHGQRELYDTELR